MRKSSLLLLPLGLVLWTAEPACIAQGICAYSYKEVCLGPSDVPCTGHLIDPYTWESVPLTAEWPAYQPQLQLHYSVRDAVTGQKLSGAIYDVTVLISEESTHTRFTTAGGNLAVITLPPQTPGDPIVEVKNDTCAPYFVRVLVRASPIDGGASDASSDGTVDALTE